MLLFHSQFATNLLLFAGEKCSKSKIVRSSIFVQMACIDTLKKHAANELLSFHAMKMTENYKYTFHQIPPSGVDYAGFLWNF